MKDKLKVLLFLAAVSTNLSAQDTRLVRMGDGEIELRKSGVLEFQSERDYRGYHVKLTNAGSILAVGYKGGVQVWDTSTNSYKLCVGESGRTYNNIALSKNGEYLAGYREKRIFVWQTSTCRMVTSLVVDKDLNNFGLAVSSNGKYLFYAHDASRLFRSREKVVLWDIEREAEIGDLRPERLPILGNGYDPFYDRDELRPSSADFSPDSTSLAVQHAYRIYLWDVDVAKAAHRLVDNSLENEASQGGIYDVRFSHDGSLLISRGADGTVKLWDVKTAGLKKAFRLKERVHGEASLSRDNKFLATSGAKGEIAVWDASSGTILWKGAMKNYFPSFSAPDLGLISVESGDIYDLRTGERIEGIKGEFLTDGKLLMKEKDENMSTWIVHRK